MKVAVACDHGAYEYKERIKEILKAMNHEVEDFGCHGSEAVDYADTVYPAAKSVADGTCDRAIVLCGTGIGASITANKVRGVRCALVSDLFTAKVTREHNDSNVLAMGQRVLGESIMEEIVRIWINTEFSNDERHVRRIDKITKVEVSEER